MDLSPTGLAARLLLQRDASFQGGLQAAELVEDLDRAVQDGSLDPGDFFTGLGIGFGWADPIVEYRPGPL